MKQRPILFSTPMVQAIMDGRKTQTRRIVNQLVIEHNDGITYDICPYGEPGDVLWVRETFHFVKDEGGEGGIYFFKAEYKTQLFKTWKPSIHMPKVAARIWLKITNVRIERLHEITEKDAIQEGVERIHYAEHKVPVYRKYNIKERIGTTNPIGSFGSLWESINGEESWLQNPWVWVIEFERIEKPE